MDGDASLQLPRHRSVLYGSTAATTAPGAIATHMESFLRDLGEARDACNKLPFDDALRDKIAAELDRIEAAPPLERMLVTKPPVKRWAELVRRQKDPSIKQTLPA